MKRRREGEDLCHIIWLFEIPLIIIFYAMQTKKPILLCSFDCEEEYLYYTIISLFL